MGWPELTPEGLRLLLDSYFLGVNSNPLELTIYPSEDTVNWRFPPFVYVPTSSMQALEFGTVGKNEGLSGHFQIIEFECPLDCLSPYGIGFRIKYSAESVSLTNAYIDLEYKVINHLGNKNISVDLIAADFLIPVPLGSTELDERYLDVGFIPSGLLSKDAMIIIKTFGRDAGHVLDTLDSRLLIEEIKPRLIQGVVPPVPPI